MPMSWGTEFRLLCAVSAVALALASGCAVGPAATPLPPQVASVVLEYQPGATEEELTLDFLRLQDSLTRAALPQAADAVEAAEDEASFLARVEDYRSLLRRQEGMYERFFALYPKNWYARHLYAGFLADAGGRYEAADQWREVIRMEPRFPYAYNNLGTLYNHMGRDLESILLYRKFIELKDDDATVWVNLAVNYSTHRGEAMKEFGWDLPRTFRECIAAYARARELEPWNHEIARDLASQFVIAHYFNVENTADEAIAAWDYYLALDLEDHERGAGLINVARIQLREKHSPTEALRLLRQAEPLVENPDVCRRLIEQAEKAIE